MTGRALGVASSKADIDGGTITGLTRLGTATGGTVGFYGTAPASQRALAAQNTTLLSTASSTAIDTLTKACIIEICNTLQALGLWKGSA